MPHPPAALGLRTQIRTALRRLAVLTLVAPVACSSGEDATAGDAPVDPVVQEATLAAAGVPVLETLPDPLPVPDPRAEDPSGMVFTWDDPAGPVLAGTVGGFDAPESVLYDEDGDVWFVSSFTGDPNVRDANGTVSRLDGETLSVDRLGWATGTEAHPFHAGRGMALQGDTLWVADLDGVHGFHRETGEQLVFVDLTAFEPGFLNDVAAVENGEVWVTDTGDPGRVLQVRPRTGRVETVGDRFGMPNGILRDETGRDWILAPWTGADSIWAWNSVDDARRLVAVSPGAGNVDGLVHWWGGLVLAAAQADSSIHALDPRTQRGRRWIGLPGRPADIGIDLGRNRLAVPYVSLGIVQIWQLAAGPG